jgi:hypothetical protein
MLCKTHGWLKGKDCGGGAGRWSWRKKWRDVETAATMKKGGKGGRKDQAT